jgi:hypothetical protein
LRARRKKFLFFILGFRTLGGLDLSLIITRSSQKNGFQVKKAIEMSKNKKRKKKRGRTEEAMCCSLHIHGKGSMISLVPQELQKGA